MTSPLEYCQIVNIRILFVKFQWAPINVMVSLKSNGFKQFENMWFKTFGQIVHNKMMNSMIAKLITPNNVGFQRNKSTN